MIFALLAAFALPAHAVDEVKPTPEEAARCAAVPVVSARNFCLSGYSVAPLHFPPAADGGSFQAMSIHKPAGAGPFPALILMHTCGDLSTNDQMPAWGRAALERGYVVFVLDSFHQRGVSGDVGCTSRGVAMSARVRDAFAAAAHLARFPFVDRNRIAAAGFSQGGRVAYFLASEGVTQVFGVGARFAAVIAVYGQCYSPSRQLNFVHADSRTPLLALLGELDDDGDPKQCLPRLQAAKGAGAPVEWHVFPHTGHTWDQPSRLPGKRMPFNEPPGSVLFEYNPAVAEQSRAMAFEFLARVMK